MDGDDEGCGSDIASIGVVDGLRGIAMREQFE